ENVTVVSAGRGSVPTVEKGGMDTFTNRTQVIRPWNPQPTHPGGPIEVQLHPCMLERLPKAQGMDLETVVPPVFELRQLPRREHTDRPRGLRSLEGHTVKLTNGNSLERVTVVSAGRAGITTVWLNVKGVDVFIDHADVIHISDPPTTRRLIEVQLHS